ncbi:hypothetical protein ACLOJK_015271 [Asimina triloba]
MFQFCYYKRGHPGEEKDTEGERHGGREERAETVGRKEALKGGKQRKGGAERSQGVGCSVAVLGKFANHPIPVDTILYMLLVTTRALAESKISSYQSSVACGLGSFNLMEMVVGMDLLMECLPVMTSCLGCFDSRTMLEKKMLGAAAAVIDDGVNSSAMRASSLATEEMSPSSLVAVVDAGLQPHQIWVRLDVVDKMGGLDCPTGCPSMVSLPEMKPTMVATVWDGGDVTIARWRSSDLGGVVTAVDLSGSDP